VTAPRTRWGRCGLFMACLATAVAVPTISYVATASDPPIRGQWLYYPTQVVPSGYVITRIGCVRARSAVALNEKFRGRLGPILGLDNAHVIDLGRGYYLWLFNDAFFDYTNTRTDLRGTTFVSNTAMLEHNGCFRIVRRDRDGRPMSFEGGGPRGIEVRTSGRYFFWPLGGEAHDGRISVFWALMKRAKPPPPGDGIGPYPVRTWLATYDARTLARLDLRPAPNPRVFPQYGFAVASRGRFSYLFGNSNLLNYSLEGGYLNGPHSATRMYLARVPRGKFGRRPEYRTARGWSDDPAAAVAISERFFAENGMRPLHIDGRWVSVTKVDGFSGTRTIVEVARRPWGPWRIVSRRRIEPFRGFDVMNNYQPIILPYRTRSGNLIIVMSQNAHHWPDAVEDPSMYRLKVYAEPWPFDEPLAARAHQ
jgi:hypothetical protein